MMRTATQTPAVAFWPQSLHYSTTPLLHYSIPKLVPEVGIAPTSPRFQRGANLPQLLGENGSPRRSTASEGWSSRQVTLLRLPVISRVMPGYPQRPWPPEQVV